MLNLKDLDIFQVFHMTVFCLINLHFVPILNLETYSENLRESSQDACKLSFPEEKGGSFSFP